MTIDLGRRRFIFVFSGAAATWPLAARAQRPASPVVGVVSGRSSGTDVRTVAAFRKGLNETGYIEGQNVTVDYHWLDGNYDRLPALMADLVRRKVAVIVTTGSAPAALAAKAATTTIPIVFGFPEDAVNLGLVASLARPGGNATGINFLINEVAAKRLRLLHDLVPKAVNIAVLNNPANAPAAAATLREVQLAAPTMGLQNPDTQRLDNRRGRCSLCHPCARAPRCALRRWRWVFHQSRHTTCHLDGAPQYAGGLWK